MMMLGKNVLVNPHHQDLQEEISDHPQMQKLTSFPNNPEIFKLYHLNSRYLITNLSTITTTAQCRNL